MAETTPAILYLEDDRFLREAINEYLDRNGDVRICAPEINNHSSYPSIAAQIRQFLEQRGLEDGFAVLLADANFDRKGNLSAVCNALRQHSIPLPSALVVLTGAFVASVLSDGKRLNTDKDAYLQRMIEDMPWIKYARFVSKPASISEITTAIQEVLAEKKADADFLYRSTEYKPPTERKEIDPLDDYLMALPKVEMGELENIFLRSFREAIGEPVEA